MTVEYTLIPGDQQLLANLDDLDQLGRVGVQIDHVARLPGSLGAVLMASPTSA